MDVVFLLENFLNDASASIRSLACQRCTVSEVHSTNANAEIEGILFKDIPKVPACPMTPVVHPPLPKAVLHVHIYLRYPLLSLQPTYHTGFC